MGKIMKQNALIRFTFIIAISFLVTACSSVRLVTIKNDSAASIDFQGEFITATDEVDNLAFQLKPGALLILGSMNLVLLIAIFWIKDLTK